MSVKNDEILEKLVLTIEHFLQIARIKNMKEKIIITSQTDLYEDLEIDSLEAMDLVAEIERIFAISSEPKEMMAKNRVEDLAEYIASIKFKKQV